MTGELYYLCIRYTDNSYAELIVCHNDVKITSEEEIISLYHPAQFLLKCLEDQTCFIKYQLFEKLKLS